MNMENKCLFPILDSHGKSPEIPEQISLFPVGADSGSNDLPANPEWLSIKSFPSKEINVETIGRDLIDNSRPDKHFKKRKHKVKTEKQKKQRVIKHTVIESEKQLEKESLRIASLSKKIFLEDVGLKPEHAFRVDRNPDQTQLCFASMYHQHVPRYNKLRVCLGHIGQFKKKSKRVFRYYSLIKNKKVILSNESAESSLSKYLTDNKKFSATTFKLAEYIPLQISVQEVGVKNYLKEKGSKDVNPLGIYDDKTVEYLSGSGGLKQGECTIGEKNIDIQRKTKRYNEDLRANPKDVGKWIEYIEFQDSVFGSEMEKSNMKSRNLKIYLPLIEKKVSIIDKALKDNPGNVSLLMLKLRLCKSFWEKGKLRKEWGKLLFSHPNNVELWKTYLHFLQTYFPTFSAKGISKEYYKCFNKLKQIVQGHFLSHLKPAGLEKVMIDIISSYCWFMKESGYQELSIGIFQAVLEYNMFPPSVKSQDLESVFEPFWDSRLPRIGEDKSIGWSKSIGIDKEIQDYNPLEKEVEDKVFELSESCENKQQAWIQMESVREKSYWLPFEQNGDEATEDPDREVTSDQVLPFVFDVGSGENKMYLLTNFMLLLGVPPISCSMSILLAQQCLEQVRLESFPAWLLQSDIRYPGCSLTALLNSLPHHGPKIHPILDGHVLFKELLTQKTLLEAKYSFFIRQLFYQTISHFKEPQRGYLIVWWFRFEYYVYLLHKETAGVDEQEYKARLRKWLKKILKEPENRTNSLLYLEYGRLERLLDNHQESKKVLLTALGLAGPDQLWTYVLYLIELYSDSNRGDMVLEETNDKHELLWCLSCIAVNERHIAYSSPTSSLVILRARKVFQNMVTYLPTPQQHISSLNDTFVALSTPRNVSIQVAYAWFQYLTLGFEPATVILETAIDSFSDSGWSKPDHPTEATWGDFCKEELYFHYIKFLLFHMRQSVCNRERLRSVLFRALADFPANGHFVALLIQIELSCSINGRLQRYFTTRLVDSYPTECVYSVLGEVTHYQRLQEYVAGESPVEGVLNTGHINKIICNLQRALSCERCQNCVLLWRLYLFMLNYFDKKKMILPTFYEALQQCPWAKALYTDTIIYVPHKLREIVTLMSEKDLRIRMPLEELDVLMEEKLEGVNHESSHDEDEESDLEVGDEGPNSVHSGVSNLQDDGDRRATTPEERSQSSSDEDDQDVIGPMPPNPE